MRRWMTYVAVVAVGGAVLVGGTAGAGDGKPTDRLSERIAVYAQPDVSSDGFLPADPNAEPPAEGEENIPKVGDEFLFTDTLYQLGGTPEAPVPVGDPIGVNSVRCLVSQVFEAEEDAASICNGLMTLDGRGDIAFQVRFRFSELADPGFLHAAITGGTGDFYDAGGQFEVREFPDDDPANDEDEVVPATYVLDLLHLAAKGS
jgi:hypothetical protein